MGGYPEAAFLVEMKLGAHVGSSLLAGWFKKLPGSEPMAPATVM
jgi:hypothetical protein